MSPRKWSAGEGVEITEAPREGAYHRLEWYEHGQRRQTTAGKTLAEAKAKAAKVVTRLRAGSQSLGLKPLGEVLETYLRSGKLTWAPNHSAVMHRELRKVLAPYVKVKAEALGKRILRDICNGSSTAIVAGHHRSRLRALLKWGFEQDYFTEAQTKLLDGYSYAPMKDPIEKKLRRTPRTNGENPDYVTPDEVPSHAQVTALGDAFQDRLRYGKVLIELAAASGLRIGELLALQVSDIVPARRQILVRRQALSVRGKGGTRLGPPKGGKDRTAMYPVVGGTGYPVEAELVARIAEVEKEYQDGGNPDRLLFPAPQGGLHWSTSFTTDHYRLAAKEAGFERLEWDEPDPRNPRQVVTRYQWRFTMHSLRHRFAHDAIELWGLTPAELTTVGGWESIAIVFDRYYGRSKDILDRVYEKTRGSA